MVQGGDDQFRQVLGHFPTGVVVVVTALADGVPPLSIVYVAGDVVHSQIQAGTEGSAQHRSSGG